MKKIFHFALIAWLSVSFAAAQERMQRVITIKNGNLGGITRTLKDLLPGTSVLISSDNEHLILSGPKEQVSSFEEIIKQLDVPAPAKKNIETTVYMIIASTQAGGGSVPPQLESVVTQLKSIFSYKGFRLLDSFVLRSRDGEKGETSGFVPPMQDPNVTAGHKIIYQFRYNRVTIDGRENASVIRFDRLSLGMKVPVASGSKGEISYLETGVTTDMDVPEGKKVVVGKTSAVEGSDSALILVISAKVVD